MRTISIDVDHARKLDNARLELAALFGNRLVTSSAVRMQHANTTTWLPAEPPDAVVFPTTGEEVQRIVVICAQHRVPIIPFGTGTSFEGQVNAPQGGVCINFRDMNDISAVHAEDFDCVVEPGCALGMTARVGELAHQHQHELRIVRRPPLVHLFQIGQFGALPGSGPPRCSWFQTGAPRHARGAFFLTCVDLAGLCQRPRS